MKVTNKVLIATPLTTILISYGAKSTRYLLHPLLNVPLWYMNEPFACTWRATGNFAALQQSCASPAHFDTYRSLVEPRAHDYRREHVLGVRSAMQGRRRPRGEWHGDRIQPYRRHQV